MPIHIHKVKRDLFLYRHDIIKPEPISQDQLEDERVLSFLSSLKRSLEKKRKYEETDASDQPPAKTYAEESDEIMTKKLQQHLEAKPKETRARGRGNGSEAASRAPEDAADPCPNLSWLINFRVSSIFGNMKNLECDDEGDAPVDEQVVYLPGKRGTSLKPGLTYTELIERALRENGELTVSGIYKWIYSNFPYYNKDDGRWKNSVRHNLSINPQFRKGSKSRNGGSGHFWTLNKEYDEQFKKWQEWKHLVQKDQKLKMRVREEEDKEILAATQSILEMSDDKDGPLTNSDTDPNLLRVATDILNGIDREVEVQFMDKHDDSTNAVIVDESCLEATESILSESLLFSDALELGFQPYELINPRL